MADADSNSDSPPSLEAVRARLDAIDAELLPLIDERASLARQVAAAKAAAGDAGKFGLRPARENAILRKLLDAPRRGARDALVVRLWRELIGDSLAQQGPFHLSVWSDRDLARVTDFARNRFGSAPSLAVAARPEDALAAARTLGGVGVLALAPENAWWGRLLAQPRLKVFAVLPCLAAWGPMTALAVAEIAIEPTGSDQTFWVTDAGASPAEIVDALGRDSAAATFLMAAGGLKLFSLAGFYQAEDPRLTRAPGSLSGVIGAAPAPLDV
jgi:chorismate mutase